MQFVHKRHYLIRDQKRGGRQVIEHTPFLRRRKILREFTEGELKKIISITRPLVEQKIKTSQVMNDFWQQASPALKDDLVLSFYYHEHLGIKKVLNVQTEDWLAMDFFNDMYTKLRRKRWQVLHPRHALRAMRATFGKHVRNLRFENIHLAVDSIGVTSFHQVHWDIMHPSSVSKMVRHFVFDDILG